MRIIPAKTGNGTLISKKTVLKESQNFSQIPFHQFSDRAPYLKSDSKFSSQFFMGKVGKCDISFFKFCHRQVRNFKILNHFERDRNFVVNFQNDQKQNQKLTKHIQFE